EAAAASHSVDGLQLAGGLNLLWSHRGHIGEGRSWIARLLAVAPRGELGAARARAHFSAGSLALDQSDFAAAEGHHPHALSIWRELGERRQIVRSIGSLGNLAYERSDLAGARTHYEEALIIAREIDDRRSIALALQHLGIVAMYAGDLSAAQKFLEES